MRDGQTIGLVMLVRDESDVIRETLKRVRPLISSWTVVDTGSTDRTPKLVEKSLAGIPGRLHRAEWRGFAENRTEALALARGTADYLLMLDADHILHVDGALPPLSHDAYLLQIVSGLEWRLPLLVRGDREWRYEGAAHAYLAGNYSRAPLDQIWIESPRKNSPRTEKIEQDALLLEAELDPRTIFYLAQTYRDLGHKREAADLYRARIRLSAANPQDVFWACYQEGCLRFETDGLAAAVPVLLEAWQRRPSRAEPLYKLAREYRLAGHVRVALMFANQAVEIPDTQDVAFVLRWVYTWGARMERALAARAIGDTDTARSDFEHLVALDLPGEDGEFMAAQLAELTPRERIAA